MHARLDASRVNILSGDERASGASAGKLIYAGRVGTGMGIPKLERVWRQHHNVAAMFPMAAVGAELPVGARSRTVGSCRHSGQSR